MTDLSFIKMETTEDKIKAIGYINNYDDLRKYFKDFINSEAELPQLLPYLLNLLERFGYQNSINAWDLVDVLRDSLRTKPELKQYIPRLVDLTGQTWLFTLAETEVQKNFLFKCVIEEHIRLAEFDKAEYLLNHTFKNNLLEDDELAYFLTLSLSHPGMYQMIQMLLPEIQKRHIINEQLVERVLTFIVTFVSDPHICQKLIDYLNHLGAFLPGFYDTYSKYLSQSNFLIYIKQQTTSRIINQDRNYAVWDSHQRWQTPYSVWPLFESMEEGLKRAWLRKQIESKIINKIPLHYTIQWFALIKYKNEHKLSQEDLLAIGRAFRNSSKQLSLEAFSDNAACLFTKRWNEIAEDMENLQKEIIPELKEIATELFANQLHNWLEIKKERRIAPVYPMPGISLGLLKKKWKGTATEWKKIWKGYEEFMNNDSETPIEEFDFPVRFHPLRAAYKNKFIEFLFYTDVPLEPVSFRSYWFKMILKIKEENPDLFLQELNRSSILTKNKIALLLRGSYNF